MKFAGFTTARTLQAATFRLAVVVAVDGTDAREAHPVLLGLLRAGGFAAKSPAAAPAWIEFDP